MITKEKLKAHIEHFPDEMTMDELIDRLIFIEKLEKRIQESEAGQSISEDQMKLEMAKWFE